MKIGVFGSYLQSQAELPEKAREPQPLAITISREVGAGGKTVAELLGQRLTAAEKTPASSPWVVFDAKAAGSWAGDSRGLLGAATIGLFNGLCLTRLNMSAFVPTLARNARPHSRQAVQCRREQAKQTSDKHRFDAAAGFRWLDPGRPSVGREFSDAIDREIGQAWEHRAEVVAER